MSKTEKRWNRVAKSLNWDQRPDGTYQAPPNAVPFLVLIVALMVAFCILTPNGKQNVEVGNFVAALIVLLMLPFAMALLVTFGRNEPSRGSYSGYRAPSPPSRRGALSPTAPSQTPAKSIIGPALMGSCCAIGRALSFC
jgi:hypothetical protein